MEGRILQFEGISNAWQLGGYQAEDGKRVKPGVLFRSGMLERATGADLEKLTQTCGVSTVIDLRTARESAQHPDPVLPGVRYEPVAVMEESRDAGNQLAIIEIYRTHKDDVGRAYVEMARAGALAEDMYTCFFTSESSMAAYRRFFEVLLDSTGPVLWHCTGGKDRAGLATVMLLSLLGVPEQTALEDFSLANEVNRTEILYKVSQAKRYTEDPEELGTVADLAGVSPACMARVFDLARAENIPMCTFIRQKLGLSWEEVAQLRKKYLE